MRAFGKMVLLAFVLASIAFLSALTAMRIAIQGRVVAMPDVVGMTTDQATTVLRSKGLGIKVEDRMYSDKPRDAVVRQSPPAGLQVKVGQRAHVVLSLGPRSVTIPSFVDKSQRAARIELLRGGSLQIGEVSSTYLPSVDADTVVGQNPSPGSSGVSSPRVDLLVSLGTRPPAYIMPELVGQSLAEVQQRITTAGLKVSKITFAPMPGITSGVITAQSPPRGSLIDASGTIALQVAE